MRHVLKTWPEYFAAVIIGTKTYEVRLDDRNFKEGDELLLREYLPPAIEKRATAKGSEVLPYTGFEKGTYTARSALVLVTHKLTGMGIKKGYCCMGIRMVSWGSGPVG